MRVCTCFRILTAICWIMNGRWSLTTTFMNATYWWNHLIQFKLTPKEIDEIKSTSLKIPTNWIFSFIKLSKDPHIFSLKYSSSHWCPWTSFKKKTSRCQYIRIKHVPSIHYMPSVWILCSLQVVIWWKPLSCQPASGSSSLTLYKSWVPR